MLPRINAQQRPKLPHNSILVRIRPDPDGAGLRILDQPGPAGALDAGERGVEFLLHGVEAAVGGVDGFAEGAGGRFAAAGGFGGEVFPEEGVVCVAACQTSLSAFSMNSYMCRSHLWLGFAYLHES